MDGSDTPDRFEIEPVANDEASIWGRGGTGPRAPEPVAYQSLGSAPLAPTTSPGDATRSPRRGLVVAGGLAAGVAALIAIAAVATSSSDSDGVEAEPSTTLDSAPSTFPTTSPDSTRPPSTVARSTTTTEPPRWQLSSIDLDPRLAGLSVRIVAVGPKEVHEIDTVAGEVMTLALRSGYGQGAVVDVGSNWIRVWSAERGDVKLFRGREQPVDLAGAFDPWSTFRQAGGDRYWSTLGYYDPSGIEVAELDHQGVKTGVTIQLDPERWLVGADPKGGVVVSAPGGYYHVDQSGSSRLTTGQVVALGPTMLLVNECGDDLTTCHVALVDRSTGASTTLEVFEHGTSTDRTEVEAITSAQGYGPSNVAPWISPDGRFAPVRAVGNGEWFGVLDLATGEFFRLTPYLESNVWWTPDGRGVLYVSEQRLMLFDFVDRTSHEVLPPDYTVIAFDVRP